MSLMNSDDAYGLVSRANHWLTALVFIPLIPMGIILEEMEDERGDIFFQLMVTHESLGVLMIGLLVMRLFWLLVDRGPASEGADPAWQAGLARLVRVVLWVGMVAMPVSGWIMSNSAGYAVSFFDLFELPAIVPESGLVHELAEEIHEALPGLLILALLLHVAGALKHHYLNGDRTLRRMTRGV